VILGCQVLIAVVFAVSAFTKLRTGVAFRSFAGSLVMVPRQARSAVAAVLAVAEAAVPLAMPVPRLGLALSGALLIVFSAGIAVSILRGLRVACRCFGPSQTPLGPVHLVRNALLLAAVVLGLLAPEQASGPSIAELAVTVPAALVTAVVLIFFDDIADLFFPAQRAR
jgi:hypothetical protein